MADGKPYYDAVVLDRYNTHVSLRIIGDVFILEAGRPEEGAYEPQRMTLSAKTLRGIGTLIANFEAAAAAHRSRKPKP